MLAGSALPAAINDESRNHRDADRARRRADRRRRPVGHRRRLSPAGAPARARRYAILEAREADRRHLGPLPLSRASARTPTCSRSATRFRPWDEREGDRRRAVDPATTSATPPTSYGIERPDPLRPPRRQRRLVLEEARWTVDVERADGGRDVDRDLRLPLRRAPATTATTRATPRSSPASSASAATVVHPQHWPEDLDYAGKRVVVIGSGATAVTLVPARWPKDAAHVTMLQRSPTYVVSMPGDDALADAPARGAARRGSPTRSCAGRTCSLMMVFFQLSRRAPELDASGFCARRSAASCPPATTSTRTSRPRYNPWDQRVCLVPDGDLFERPARRQRRDRHRPDRDASPRRVSARAGGETLEADVIVTATGPATC